MYHYAPARARDLDASCEDHQETHYKSIEPFWSPKNQGCEISHRTVTIHSWLRRYHRWLRPAIGGDLHLWN